MPIHIREILEDEPPVVRVDRVMPCPVAELWRWVTEPQLTARWIGPWQRLSDDIIEITWSLEEGAPTEQARILEVLDGHGYTLEFTGMETSWVVLISVQPDGDSSESGSSRFTLIQALNDPAELPAIQAGWSYYADCLLAALTGSALPDFADY